MFGRCPACNWSPSSAHVFKASMHTVVLHRPALAHTPRTAPPLSAHTMFPTIYEWSVAHIRDVFEAKSEDACRRALAETFAHDIEFTTNGRALAPHDLQRFVLAMVAGSGFRLQVHWQNALEVPRDESNRVSARRVAVTCDASADAQAGVLGRRARRVLHHQQRPQACGGRRALGACRAAQVRQRRVRGSHLSRACAGTHAASSSPAASSRNQTTPRSTAGGSSDLTSPRRINRSRRATGRGHWAGFVSHFIEGLRVVHLRIIDAF